MAGSSRRISNAKSGKTLTRLTIGELPATMRRQTQNCRRYRRQLEGLVTDRRGRIDPMDAHLIDEAVQAEVHAAVCRWLLRNRLEKMTVSDIRACSEAILKSKTIRNKAIEALDLAVKPEDPWAVIDAEIADGR